MRDYKKSNGHALIRGVIIIIVILMVGVTVLKFTILNNIEIDLNEIKEKVFTVVGNLKEDVEETKQEKQEERENKKIPELELSKTDFVEYTDEHKIEFVVESDIQKLTYSENSEFKEKEEGTALIKFKGEMYIAEYEKTVDLDDKKVNKIKISKKISEMPEMYAAIVEGSKVYEQTLDNGTVKYESFEYNDNIYTKMISITSNGMFEKETTTIFEDYPDIYYNQNR